MEKIGAMATAFSNGDFICIVAQSVGMMAYPEPSASPHYLSPDVGDAALGSALRAALASSKHVSVEEFQKIWNSGVIENIESERDDWIKKQYGYKTKRAMYKNMDTCNVSGIDDRVKIQPTHQKTLDGYTVRKDEGPFPLYVPGAAADAELGAALREGFKRCTSAIR
ncbi:contact-dependent growth inhibition system immunity protein [Ralstonia pseudosolanacearum]|uniref:contact-dependent growth inhibition system immunity protein n=1 Tax=Ralstonia pseudosolanacearum TaxID=1310165 RepID=UPI0018D0B1C0|nr:contact-dependent growth inhibition system immunity protein [Ralstonia pseudosolanacearum]